MTAVRCTCSTCPIHRAPPPPDPRWRWRVYMTSNGEDRLHLFKAGRLRSLCSGVLFAETEIRSLIDVPPCWRCRAMAARQELEVQ